MKRVISIMLILFAFLCVLNGCGRLDVYKLPDKPIAFQQGTFENPNDEFDTYVSITYNGREYIPYGAFKDNIDLDEVDRCIGYIQVDTDTESNQVRVCTLKGTDDFLMECITDAIMEQPSFYRAVDTQNKEMEIPDYMESSGDDYWK